MSVRRIEGRLLGAGKSFAIVASRFNSRVVDRLVEGATSCLLRHGVDAEDVVVVRVPGAWEIPLALDELAKSSKFAGMVAIGTVIRGETPHFDFVCGACSSGVARISERHGIPIGFGVLTCDNSQQAEERAGGKLGNKGWEAAEAALEMIEVLQDVRNLGQDS